MLFISFFRLFDGDSFSWSIKFFSLFCLVPNVKVYIKFKRKYQKVSESIKKYQKVSESVDLKKIEHKEHGEKYNLKLNLRNLYNPLV